MLSFSDVRVCMWLLLVRWSRSDASRACFASHSVKSQIFPFLHPQILYSQGYLTFRTHTLTVSSVCHHVSEG